MSRIVFEDARLIPAAEPDRTDVACFVGLARARAGAVLSKGQMEWLRRYGWLDPNYARDLSAFADVPLIFENFTAFEAIFDSGGGAASTGSDYLAAAVRSFFSQGGRRCYVVRMGDPVAGRLTAAQRDTLPRTLVPPDASANDRASWHGIAHLWGLPDASFLLLPDLPLLFASAALVDKGVASDPARGPEQFVECTPADITPAEPRVYAQGAPRLTQDDYGRWGAQLRQVIGFLRNGRLREVQLVAALPLPVDAEGAAAASNLRDVVASVLPENLDPAASASSAFLQLSYPWLRTRGSGVLSESLEPPDGMLAGLLARNALTRGAYTSATKVAPADVIDVYPQLPQFETRVPDGPLRWGDQSVKPLVTRVSLFGFTPAGINLLSDVTTYPGESYRAARVNRLVSVISRASRRMGDDLVFQGNTPGLWAKLRSVLREVMLRLWRMQALDGAAPGDAFSIRCDRGTMTQNDIDNGRLIAEITFRAAAVIELIRVTLALEPGGASVSDTEAGVVGVA